jgi:redox-sensitive bicupin YhaK (pirin superfamily)
MKSLVGLYHAPPGHWVGDGFPVRTLFSYGRLGQLLSPFLLFDYAGPMDFTPAVKPRGVGEHPHRGFETVTLVYSGEVTHRDSAGGGGTIGPGDVQWMTASAGLMHEEFHSEAFTRSGGHFECVQLWVNLPAKDKGVPPHYQTILAGDIPTVELPDGAGSMRLIAGEFAGTQGPAKSFTPMYLWDLRLNAGAEIELPVREGWTAVVALLRGGVTLEGGEVMTDADLAIFTLEGSNLRLTARSDSVLVVLGGEPIREPIAGYGPFVMNTRREIEEAFEDLQAGRFGSLPVAPG